MIVGFCCLGFDRLSHRDGGGFDRLSHRYDFDRPATTAVVVGLVEATGTISQASHNRGG
jgi:hypothetical protein